MLDTHRRNYIKFALLEGFGDKVRCFTCQGEVKNWEAGSDPLAKHRELFGQCAYAKDPKF